MRISRYLRYALLSILSLCAFSAYAVERPVSYIAASVGEFHGGALVRHEAALAYALQDRGADLALSTGGLRSEGHHLVQVSVPARELPALL